MQGQKQIGALKVDLHVSVVKLARHVAMHKPRLVLGKGQGSVVALAYGHPGCLEQVLATRNVQPAELPEISQSWGNVAAIVLQEPRLSKKGVQSSNIRAASPEMFEDYPVASRRTFSWHDKKITHYLDTKEFLKETKVEVVESFGAIPFAELLGQPPLLMWEHQGRCPCGKRSYLFGQCSKCLKEDLEIKATEESVAVQPEVCNDEATFDLDGAEAKTGGSLRSSPLPSILPMPDIRTGTEMRHIEFITESAVKLISRDGPDGNHAKGRKGVVYVQHWAPHSEFELKAKAKASVASSDYPYRIAFVVELSGDVVPLQQCTDVRFEDEHLGHKAKKPQWIRDPACLIGMWEPSPVSKQLDVWIRRRKGDEIDEQVRVEGAIRKFVLLVRTPMPMCRLVIRRSGKKRDWGQELWDYIIGFEADSADYTRAVVFGRSSVLERWIVVYASEFPTTA